MERSSFRRRFLAVVILLLWLGMVGWQVRREHFQPELTRLAESARSIAPGVAFYSLLMGDVAVGVATSRLDTVADGFRVEDVMALELPALGQLGRASVRTRVRLSPALLMREFSFSVDSDGGRIEVGGSVVGDTLLHMTVDAGSGGDSVTYRLGEPPVFAAILPVRVAAGGALEVGENLRLPVFDPTSLTTRAVEVRVLDFDTLLVPDSAVLEGGRWHPVHFDSVPSWKIDEEYAGVRLESWVDEDGRIVRASSPLGFSMVRTEYELARQALEEARSGGVGEPAGDLVLDTAIRSNVDLGSIEEYDELRFRLSGVDLSGFQLQGGRQELRGDTLVIRRESWADLHAGYALPYPRMDLNDALRAEPLIQSADPRIIRAAERLTERDLRWRLDPRAAARRLTLGVYELLDKRITFSVPSAVQVLDRRAGDCNEHTVLYVAMARSMGLPARTAVGLVYVGGSFFYHAWPEVWLGDWVAVDPTFGQYPADAAHIRFTVGGLAQQVEIVRLIGRLRVEVLHGADVMGRVDP